ncbi:hypothetical protein QJQ45_022333 [Haematococcus lacustris]|nr:hypothetical protein QJQ45_022333 [Haematococcus lacustris]
MIAVQQRSGMLTSGLRQRMSSVPGSLRARRTAVRVVAYREGSEAGEGRVARDAPLTGYPQLNLSSTPSTAAYDNEATSELWDRLKARWEGVQYKRSWLVGAAGLLFGSWICSAVLDRVEHLPLLPNLLLFIGLLQSGQFFWRYVLFGEGRVELRGKLSSAFEQFRDAVEGQGTPFSQFVSSGGVDDGASNGAASSFASSPVTPAASTTSSTASTTSSGSKGAAIGSVLSGDAGGSSEPSAAQLQDATPIPPYPSLSAALRSLPQEDTLPPSAGAFMLTEDAAKNPAAISLGSEGAHKPGKAGSPVSFRQGGDSSE